MTPPWAQESVNLIENSPNLRLVTLDTTLARQAARIAVANHLRGADAVCIAVAQTFNATLVTWDTEVLRRCPSAVLTVTPEQWLSQT
ncbi:MAG: PIN domain-containing protein [Anaerolineae bacterium]